MRHHWRKPGYWAWWWREQAPRGLKGSLALIAAVGIAVAGYLTVGQIDSPEQVVFTERVTTVTSTVLVKGKPRVITEVRTTRLPAKTRVVVRDGKTVTLRSPGETVTRTTTVAQTRTVPGPVRKSVVVRNHTVTQTVSRDRLVRVTLPGVTLPGTTVQGPERVITTTLPERVVTAPNDTVVVTQTGPTQTVTSPAQTVTNTQTVTGPTTTVTGPTVTVTGPTVTQTVTETVTVTVPAPPAP